MSILAGCFSLFSAYARDLCVSYANRTPAPDWYDDLCLKKEGGGIPSLTGGGYSTFADSFNINPATIPTVNIPIGLEAIYSQPPTQSDSPQRTNVSVIKGFRKFGFGLSTDSEDTIFSNRETKPVTTASIPSTSPSPSPSPSTVSGQAGLPSISLGSALELSALSKSIEQLPLPTLGAFARFNRDNNTFSPGFGFSQAIWKFDVGLSYLFEGPSGVFPKTRVSTLSLGFRLWIFQLEAIHMENRAVIYNRDVTILMASTSWGNLNINLAIRNAKRNDGSPDSFTHLGLQYAFSNGFALGYLINYIPGYQSFSAQMLF